jgi:hypothetical protein
LALSAQTLRFDFSALSAASQESSLRAAFQVTGRLLSYDAATGLLRLQDDGAGALDKPVRCVLARVTGDGETRSLLFVAPRLVDGVAASDDCAALTTGEAPGAAQCAAATDGASLPALVAVASVVDRAVLRPTCALSSWSPWGACSKACDNGASPGVLRRVRVAIVNNASSSAPVACTADLEETKTCNTQLCSSIPCAYAPWSSWSSCSLQCGFGGEQLRTRLPLRTSLPNDACVQPAAPGELPPTHETRPCAPAVQPCQLETTCQVGVWSQWSACTQRCQPTTSTAIGTRTRYRGVLAAPTGANVTCPTQTETAPCGSLKCQPNCVNCLAMHVRNGTDWCRCCKHAAVCSRTTSNFDVAGCNAAGFCSTLCIADDTCDDKGTRLDCVVGEWSSWGACVGGTCSDGAAAVSGTRSRHRIATRQAFNGGAACPPLDEEADCAPSCPSQAAADADPCRATAWTEWAACQCEQRRTRTRVVAPLSAGASCIATDSDACPETMCPQDCVYGQWTTWSDCPSRCGGARQRRSRVAERAAVNGGAECTALSEDRVCNSIACDRDCVLNDFGTWSACSVSCGSGTRSRSRTVLFAPIGRTARPCPALTEADACGEPCPTEGTTSPPTTAAPTSVASTTAASRDTTAEDSLSLVPSEGLSPTELILAIVIPIIAVILIGVIVFGVLQYRRQKIENDKRGVVMFDTVTRTDPLGAPGAVAGAAQDTSSVDEGSEIREFRRQQQHQKRRRSNKSETPTDSAAPSSQNSARKEKSAAPAATTTTTTPTTTTATPAAPVAPAAAKADDKSSSSGSESDPKAKKKATPAKADAKKKDASESYEYSYSYSYEEK